MSLILQYLDSESSRYILLRTITAKVLAPIASEEDVCVQGQMVGVEKQLLIWENAHTCKYENVVV
jgi:hypothetical protein